MKAVWLLLRVSFYDHWPIQNACGFLSTLRLPLWSLFKTDLLRQTIEGTQSCRRHQTTCFGRVRHLAAPGAKSAVSDCLLFVGVMQVHVLGRLGWASSHWACLDGRSTGVTSDGRRRRSAVLAQRSDGRPGRGPVLLDRREAQVRPLGAAGRQRPSCGRRRRHAASPGHSDSARRLGLLGRLAHARHLRLQQAHVSWWASCWPARCRRWCSSVNRSTRLRRIATASR